MIWQKDQVIQILMVDSILSQITFTGEAAATKHLTEEKNYNQYNTVYKENTDRSSVLNQKRSKKTFYEGLVHEDKYLNFIMIQILATEQEVQTVHRLQKKTLKHKMHVFKLLLIKHYIKKIEVRICNSNLSKLFTTTYLYF